MKRLIRVVMVLSFAAVTFLAGYLYERWREARSDKTQVSQHRIAYYQDPMHPWYRSDKPGVAPDCGMQLVPVYLDGTVGSGANAVPERRIVRYQDPKQPSYTSDKRGINPETGDDLEPVYESAPAAAGAIQVNTDRQQLTGLRYTQVEVAAGKTSIRAVGRVAEDETRITRVHSKVDGWIDKVAVAFGGEFVRQGDTLLTIYSPELVSVQQEYLLALKARDVMSHSSMSELSGNSGSLVQAAHRRLELLDLSAAQISELEQNGAASKTVAVVSPATGYVLARNAFPSERITAETELYQIADLSRVWVVADVFETDAPNIRVGQAAHIKAPNDNGIDLTARVSYIQPEVDPATRTWKVRLDVPNRHMKLKPQMYLEVTFDITTSAALEIPSEAVIESGSGSTVFVDRGNGFFEPRKVQAGQRLGDRIQILSGLKAGERIVSSGAFLLDSESQLRSAAEPTKEAAPHSHGATP